MDIYLVRHGESMGNVNHKVHETTADHAISLSSDGFLQAVKAGNWLKNNLPNLSNFGFFTNNLTRRAHRRVWSSPYLRTRQTAKTIYEVVGEPMVTDYREHVLLCEQQFGLFDGVPDEELPIRYPDEHAHYSKCEKFEGRFWARMPLGESRFDVAQRVHQAFGTFHRDAPAEQHPRPYHRGPRGDNPCFRDDVVQPSIRVV